MCSRPEVCFSIVEAVMVDMVNDERMWRVYYLSVHLNTEAFFVFPSPDSSAGVKGVYALHGIPFVFV